MRRSLNLSLFLASIALGETFEVITPNYEITDNRVRIEGGGSRLDPNKPRMPAKSVWLLLPPGTEITNCKVKRKLQPLPDKYSISSTPYKLTEGRIVEKITDEAYPMDILYPLTGGRYLGTHNLLGYELAKVAILPFAHNAKTGELLYAPNIIIDIDYTISNLGSHDVDTTIDNILRDYVLNFEQKDKWYNATTLNNYIIIATNEIIPILRDFIEWKQSIGYKVKVVSPDDALNSIGNSKYILIIGEQEEVQYALRTTHYAIIGNIPYTEPHILSSILERTIEFELNKKRKRLLFVPGVANYENENYSALQREDKNELLRNLESLIPTDWEIDEVSNEVISGNYTMINFLTLGKQWVDDDEDNVPEQDEIKINKYSLFNETPSIVFSPFPGAKFLKQGAVCVIAPDSVSQYIVGWKDPSDGGNQSFNYGFLKYLMDNHIVGDAFLVSKLWYETYFPYETLNFKIFGDPSINLYGVPAVDIAITYTTVKWIDPDTGFSLNCKVINLGRMRETNCKLYCEIDSCGTSIYSQSIVIDTIKPKEEKLIYFHEWNAYQSGVDYRVKFEVFSPKDENTENDTLSIIAYVAEGDFVVVGDTTATIQKTLTKLGYKGVNTDEIIFQYLKNFSSIFICNDVGNFESLLPAITNIYIENSNRWLAKSLKVKKIIQPIEPPISGMGLSFTPSTYEITTDSTEWFVPDDCIPIFTDKRGKTAGFLYESPDNKIWCSRFKISQVDDSIGITLINLVMQFFGVTTSEEAKPEAEVSNITIFEALPNPFYDKTCIRFKIEKEPTKINISVYNLAGTRTKQILNEFKEVGEYSVVWDATDDNRKLVVNGVYFLKLQAGEQSKLIKLILFR